MQQKQQQQQHSCTDPFAVSPRLASPHFTSPGLPSVCKRRSIIKEESVENLNKHKNQKKAQGKINLCEGTESWRDVANTPLSFRIRWSSWAIGSTLLPASATFYPVKRTFAFWFLLSPAPSSFVHACCLRSRFGPRGHYSLWGCQAGQGKATGILHDWPSAAEPLTRSDKSFHSRAGTIYLEYHLLLRVHAPCLLSPC